MRKNMFYGAHPLVFEMAKGLRRNMTDAETILWDFLITRPYGFKFRRQHPIGIYIADFYCHRLHLVIEVDGSIHDLERVRKNDKSRQQPIKDCGRAIWRFRNEEVLGNKESVIRKIQEFIIQYKECQKE